MNASRSLLIAAALLCLGQCPGVAQESNTKPPEKSLKGLPIFDKRPPDSPSANRKSMMSAAEIRQARAIIRARERRSRMEHNLWLGHEPLRPNWNVAPMMRSRYERSVIQVPIYYYR